MGLCMRWAQHAALAGHLRVPPAGRASPSGAARRSRSTSARLHVGDATAQKIWGVLLLAYCLVAAMVPMWLLLQPRGHLGGCFLYVALAGAVIGLVASDRARPVFGGDATIRYPAFTGWQTAKAGSLMPMLFITIACGACSGFHSLIASGTTSKQLRRETDARPIGYGTMLLEAMVAVVSLCCVMVLAARRVRSRSSRRTSSTPSAWDGSWRSSACRRRSASRSPSWRSRRSSTTRSTCARGWAATSSRS